MKTFVLSNGDIQLGDWEFRTDLQSTILVYMITHRCNFKCSYCCGGNTGVLGDSLVDKHGIQKVIDAFVFLQEQSKRKLFIEFTGGEPFLVDGWIDLVMRLSERISLGIETNLSTDDIAEFIRKVNPEKIGLLNATYHFVILDKNPVLQQKYFLNSEMLVDAGFAPACKIIAVPWELSPVIKFEDRLTKLHEKLPQGCIIYVSLFIGTWNGKQYPFAYTEEQRKFLDKIITVRKTEQLDYIRGAGSFKGMLCDAGRGALYLSREGELYRCWADQKGKSLGNLMQGNIRLLDSPTPCLYEECGCVLRGLWQGFESWKYFEGGVPSEYNRFYANEIMSK
ncbi:GTP 3',8-cyclase [subsurface metagenome]